MAGRTGAVLLVALAMMTVPLAVLEPTGEAQAQTGEIQVVPEVAQGFAVQPLAALPVPTAINFGPGDGEALPGGLQQDGPDLYAATLVGDIYRLDLTWTPAGPVVEDINVFATGFNLPLGIAFDADGIAYVSDSHASPHPDRSVDGVVYWIDEDGEKQVLVDGLPNGRHNTNHLRFGPDDRLWLPNGNPNDNGVDGGAADVYPFSGAFLSVDPDVLRGNPAVFEWFDEHGDPIPDTEAGVHEVNEDFGALVTVEAFGFRNIFGVAFGPDGVAYTGMNGADAPSSQDALYRLDAGQGAFYGYPFCYNEGDPGATGADISKRLNPTYPDYPHGVDEPGVDEVACDQLPTADAMLGWHTCATGIDFPTDGPWSFEDNLLGNFQSSVYVGECAFFFAEDWLTNTLAHPTTHNTAHKVVRVELDADGEPVGVNDFVTGLALPTDVRFGPDGAMYIADAEGLMRVAPATGAVPSNP